MKTAGVPPIATRADMPNVSGGSTIFTLAVLVVAMAGLYFGRELFVPLALAALLSFALAPIVRWLRRLHIARIPAVLATVIAAFLVIGAFGTMVAWQVMDLAEKLPSYQTNIERKVDALREGPAAGGAISRLSTMFQRLSKRITEEEAAPVPAPGQPTPPVLSTEAPQPETGEVEPIPVRITQPELAPLDLLRTVVGPLISPLATGGIVIVFVIFMLLQREDLRDRLIRLAGTRDLQRTTEALDDAAKRVAHYLLMQLVVNVTYGIPIGFGLWLIGVPNPVLWGLLTVVLRFVPYIGPIVAAAFPLLLAIAVDPGWSMLLWAAALFIIVELISNNIIEPMLYGSSTGLSPVAIIVAAIFWTWLWGPIGLLLSTPLTVCLLVLGQHVPQLAFLDVLFGNQPVLTPAENLYQRLLVGDPDEASERAEDFLEEHTLESFYDEVAIPALIYAERDRSRGTLDDARWMQVAAGAMTLVENLEDHIDDPEIPEEPAAADPKQANGAGASGEPREAVEDNTPVRKAVTLPASWLDRPVLCAGARSNLDDVPAAMLAQLLERRGIATRVLPFDKLPSDRMAQLDLGDVGMICISYLNPDALSHARYLVRRLRRRLPNVPILVGFWSLSPDEFARRDPLSAVRADRLVTSLREAVDQVIEEASQEDTEAEKADREAVPPLRPAAVV